jgi:cytochrome b
MKEIIGDDYPTYEDSVKMTLAERELRKDAVTDKILLSRVLHRLACIEDDIKIVTRHIKDNCNETFKQPSHNEDGSIFADEAWHNITNIEIACDLTDDESLEWESRVKNKLTREEEENMYQQIN